ncbi:hypothetical protein MF628_000958 [Paenibacillus polymyxa]|nr:hypothetical protein [Paenibacillus polymyxa]URJ46428.1 hypothetical protein MF628_000958 [Paenibacillus polymyxa]
MHINMFPQETQDFIHELCAKAVLRAIKNGTFKDNEPQISEKEFESSDS